MCDIYKRYTLNHAQNTVVWYVYWLHVSSHGTEMAGTESAHSSREHCIYPRCIYLKYM